MQSSIRSLAAIPYRAGIFAIITACFIVAPTLLSAQEASDGSTSSPASYTLSGRTISRYSLMLFGFNSTELSPISRRILQEHVMEDIGIEAHVEVMGHNDVIGLEDHNRRLSRQRAEAVAALIRRYLKGRYASLTVKGVGEDDPLYTNLLPEGRFYNRTVQITIIQPPKHERD